MESLIHPNLPKELILEIILRLPVKSLLRFKCVSTQWNTLIGSSSFVNQHFAHKSNQERLLTVIYKPDEQKYAFMLHAINQLSQCEELNHLQIPDTVEEIMALANGVFCLVNSFGEIALLNPAMRQFKLIPDLVNPSYINQSHLSLIDQEFGFGLDPSNGDFKVVSIQYFWDDENEDSYHPCLISIYNSGSDSWRHFEEVDIVNWNRGIRKSLANTSLNGVYYWLIGLNDEDEDEDDVLSVLAFDMRREEFREIETSEALEFPHVKIVLYGDAFALLPSESSAPWVTRVSSQDRITEEDVRGIFVYKESLVSVKGRGDRCCSWDTSSDVVKNFLRESP